MGEEHSDPSVPSSLSDSTGPLLWEGRGPQQVEGGGDRVCGISRYVHEPGDSFFLIKKILKIFIDISEVSIERCKERYHSKKLSRGNRPVFDAEFIVADCCTVSIQLVYLLVGF